MSYEKELLEVAIYQCGKLTPNEEDRLYEWIESLILAKRKADEYEANLSEVRKQLKIKIRHTRRDGDYSEAYAFSEALDMIKNSI